MVFFPTVGSFRLFYRAPKTLHLIQYIPQKPSLLMDLFCPSSPPSFFFLRHLLPKRYLRVTGRSSGILPPSMCPLTPRLGSPQLNFFFYTFSRPPPLFGRCCCPKEVFIWWLGLVGRSLFFLFLYEFPI